MEVYGVEIKYVGNEEGTTVEYSLDNTSWNKYNQEITLNENATIYVRIMKNGEIIKTAQKTIDNIDKQAPIVNANINETTITIDITEDESGLANNNKYEFYLSDSSAALTGGNWRTYYAGNSIELDTLGTKYVFIRKIKDNVGNTSISLGTEVNISGESYLRFGPFVFETVDVEVEVTVAEPSKKYIKTGEEVNYQITLSETATVDKNKITLTGDGVTGSTIEVTGSGTSYVATVTGGTGNGAVTLNVEAGAFTNSVGNQNRLTTKTGLTLDNIAPQVTIGDPSHTYIGVGETATYEITVSETVTLDRDKVSLSGTGSTESRVEITGSGTSFVATVTAGSESGEIILNIGAGTFTDVAGNTSTLETKAGLTVDNIVPTVTIGNPSKTSIKSGETSTYEITVSKEVTLNSSKITLSGTGSTGSTVEITGSGRNYTAIVAGGTGNGEVTLNIDTGAFTDSAGNTNGTSTKTGLTVDNTAPTVTIGSPSKTRIKSGGTATYEITVSETATLDKTKITVSGTSTVEITGSGTSYIVTVTGGTGNSLITLNVEAGAFTDTAGNANSAASKTGLILDNLSPQITIGDASTAYIGERRNSNI